MRKRITKALALLFVAIVVITIVSSAIKNNKVISAISPYGFLNDGIFRVSAHRGAPSMPENTEESINLACNLGYGAVEIDPRWSLDGIGYLMHDSDVERTTNGSGDIEGMYSDEIEALEIDVTGFPECQQRALRVPKLASAIHALEGKKVVLNIDCSKSGWSSIKQFDVVVEMLQKYNMLKWTFFVISDKEIRDMALEKYPYLCVSWLYDPTKQTIDEYNDMSWHGLMSVKDEYVDKVTMEKLLKSGIFFKYME